MSNHTRDSNMHFKRKKIVIALFTGFIASHLQAAELNTKLPAKKEAEMLVTIDLPSQPLDISLSQFSLLSGMDVSYDSDLAHKTRAPGVKGRMTRKEALQKLLSGSGLSATITGDSARISQAPQEDKTIQLDEINVRAKRFKQLGPMPGLALTKEQIAGNIQSITAKEIKEAHSLSLADLLNSKLQSVNVNDYQGNPFQMDVTYRGFTASPQIGSPQGLSVFFDGIRVNEPFGDVVNWDMLPMNALSGFDLIPGSNPLYGLNTLGGALTMKTKSGFTDAGISAEVLAGSFGRKQLQASGGWNNAIKEEGSWDTTGDYAAFGAVNLFMEDGWRDNSPSKVNQAFGKLEWQGDRASLAFSALGVVNKLTGNGTVPQELYREDPAAVFTSPDVTRNKLIQFQIAGAFDVNDKVNITGQVYHRQSNRRSSTGDIIDYESFNDPDASASHHASRRAAPGETINCAVADSNQDGVPNYYVLDDSMLFPFLFSGNGTPFNYDYSLATLNADLPPDLFAAIQNTLKSNPIISPLSNDGWIDTPSGGGHLSQMLSPGFGLTYDDRDVDGNVIATKHIFTAPPINADTCVLQSAGLNTGKLGEQLILAALPYRDRDGANDIVSGGKAAGVVEGTPTGIITKSGIEQTTKGANVQINFNLDQHKLMFGSAIVQSSSDYGAKQRLGVMDNKRNVYSDPLMLGEEYYAADHDFEINKFNGSSTTKSLYVSETWSPTQTLNLSVSGRYNHTKVSNTVAPRVAERNLTSFNFYNHYLLDGAVVVPGDTIANSPIDLSKPIPAVNPYYFGGGAPLTILPGATEKFKYQRFNPAIGATWQAKPNLNIYANWSQGTRVPSVIELGCAYDGTLVSRGKDQNGNDILAPRSIVEGRGCALPSTLSGDPYLPQVKAQTLEAGARGKFSEFLEWNITAYRTDLRNDIYMTSLTPELSFFQDIGNTRRQGIEFGLAGEYGKSDFRINYSLTEATFQSRFNTISPNNSSRGYYGVNENMIQVKPGNVMPGVPFNNINFNWGYKLTPKFKINTTVVAHSDSFLRGNENNAHTPSQGPIVIRNLQNQGRPVAIKLPDNNYSGKSPGYAVINMNARYDLGGGWAASALINNVLDKKYYTAGRLGINPIAPSTFGAIGPGGFNYNSSEWIPSQFISAGAPRGVWFSLSYDFDRSKKTALNTATITEPNLIDIAPPSNVPSIEEAAFNKQLDTIKALPLLKRTQISTKVAKQEVIDNVEVWRKALAENQISAYLAMYAEGYSPPGINREQWIETEKMRFVLSAGESVGLDNLVVVPEGKRLVAVFDQKTAANHQEQSVLKALTFELKDGRWQITREQTTPTNHVMTTPNKPIEATHEKASSLQRLDSPKNTVMTKANTLAYREAK
ncbi:outer membrane receptor protein [Methylophilaceae bacterium 11]|nr:outer membrane receptor protein [Methylophilaceae bacterium 11]